MSDEGKESIKIVWMLLKMLDFVSKYGIISYVEVTYETNKAIRATNDRRRKATAKSAGRG